MTWFSVTSEPSSFNAPTVSRVVISTETKVSESASEYPKSAVAMASCVSSFVVSVLSAAVGAVFTDST